MHYIGIHFDIFDAGSVGVGSYSLAVKNSATIWMAYDENVSFRYNDCKWVLLFFVEDFKEFHWRA